MLCRWISFTDVSNEFSAFFFNVCKALNQLELIVTLKIQAVNYTKRRNI